ncbi:hypothetical protein HanIR_Chr08g0374521 [Helianthus annuus]|nr:hypothetical protein HanIR_Chr08g0374521 [Helianthus annuus]
MMKENLRPGNLLNFLFFLSLGSMGKFFMVSSQFLEFVFILGDPISPKLMLK